MAVFHINYPSPVMNRNMAMNVLLPDEDKGFCDSKGKYPLLYLLHGYTDDYSRWMRMTSIERYAMELGFAVVMPEGGKSFYTDMVSGEPYFTHLTEELPEILKKWFPITDEPEFTYIGGLSMGGYGAMKIGLTYPDRYQAVASFSGALAIAQTANQGVPEDAEDWLKRTEKDVRLVFGDVDHLVGTEHDVYWLVGKLASEGLKFPDFYVSCGSEDFILEASRSFKDTMERFKVPCHYHELEGSHEWRVWDIEVERFMKWILEKRT